MIRPETIGRLRCRVIAGAANNQLSDAAMGDELKQRGIVYAPDFAINAGGVINIGEELGRVVRRGAGAAVSVERDRADAGRRVRAVRAATAWRPTGRAEQMARERISAARVADRAGPAHLGRGGADAVGLHRQHDAVGAQHGVGVQAVGGQVARVVAAARLLDRPVCS